jgi:uncharacterized protein (DUF486 family)
MATIVLLVLSNLFMTFAWYGHLKYTDAPLLKVVLVSWGIAFFEYCLMVPANRMGYLRFSGYELKIIQEVITLTIFVGFALLYLREAPRWNHLAAFVFIFLAVCCAALPTRKAPPADAGAPVEMHTPGATP